jgi:hypothetical protein
MFTKEEEEEGVIYLKKFRSNYPCLKDIKTGCPQWQLDKMVSIVNNGRNSCISDPRIQLMVINEIGVKSNRYIIVFDTSSLMRQFRSEYIKKYNMLSKTVFVTSFYEMLYNDVCDDDDDELSDILSDDEYIIIISSVSIKKLVKVMRKTKSVAQMTFFNDTKICTSKYLGRTIKISSNSTRKKSPYKKAMDDTIRIKKVLYHIQNNTPSGKKIMDSFELEIKQLFGKVTSGNGGGRNTHYDFLIYDINNDEKRVELKANEKKSIIDYTKNPWVNCVQFYNGIGNKYSIAKDYARNFYDIMLDKIILHFKLTSSKPSYDEWCKDAFTCGNNNLTTDLVREFYNKIKEVQTQPKHSSEMVKLNEFYVIFKRFNLEFISSITQQQLEILREEVYITANNALKDKDYWIQIHGDLDNPDDFNCRWSNKINMSPIVDIKCIPGKSGCDINFEFVCENNSVFTSKLRWGGNKCVSNIRMDIK